jgi:hypothetical protein
MFSPYLLFISTFLVIGVNILFIIYAKPNWIILLIFNLIITVIMNMIGLGQYDLITVIVTKIGEILVDIFGNIFKAIGDAIGGLFDWF